MTVSALQVLPEIRAEQAARLTSYPDVDAAYFGTKWDLGRTEIPDRVRPFTRLGLVGFLLRNHVVSLELPEPLWIRELPTTMLLASAARLRSVVTRQGTRIGFYGIENNGFADLIGRGVVARTLTPVVRSMLNAVLPLMFDRTVFGSPAAMTAYADVCPKLADRGTLHLELPAPAQLTPLAEKWSCAFVGELSARKGVAHLMEAWERVEVAIPGATLVLVGDGPMGPLVRDWCSRAPHTRSALGLVEASEVRAILASVDVLAAPSVRDGRWREQIGLPIKEALSVGATVVTTDDSGLGGWLSTNGHHVIPVSQVRDRLAVELVEAISRPIDKSQVLASLPSEDGRAAANRALHA